MQEPALRPHCPASTPPSRGRTSPWSSGFLRLKASARGSGVRRPLCLRSRVAGSGKVKSDHAAPPDQVKTNVRSSRILVVSAIRNPSEVRSEEHTSELQSLMRISYAVFCLKKKKI